MDTIPNLSPTQAEQISFSFSPPHDAAMPTESGKNGQEQATSEALGLTATPNFRSRSPGNRRSGPRGGAGAPPKDPDGAGSNVHAVARSRGRLSVGATMRDLLDLVAKDPELTESKRRNLTCSVRKFVEHLGLDLHLPATFPDYRGHLKRFHLGNARISNRRWGNIKSDVAFALKRYDARKTWDGPRDLLPAWQALRKTLPSDRFRLGLSRPMHWCSRNGIDPEQVDDAVLADFHRHLIEETFEQKPDRIYRDTCKLWNDAVEQIPGWPRQKVTLPCFRKLVSLPRTEIPEAFWMDFERYRRCRLGQDLTSDRRYDTTAKASTIDGHEKQLRRFASAMVRVGRPAAEIVALPSLYDQPWFEEAIQSEHDRLGGPCPSLQELASTLLVIARNYLDLPEKRVEEIARIKRRLKCRVRGFTEKNRERLRQFRDPRNQAAFLFFGDHLLKLVPKATSPRKAALLVQTALIHEILLVAPMRMENLTTLHIHRNLRFSGPGRKGKIVIVIQGSDVKNGVDLEFELPTPTAELLRRYLDRYRPLLLNGVDADWLFPGNRPELQKHQVTLSGQLCKSLKRHTGLVVNPHLYRHIAAYFYLEAHPNDYETVRRLLGHKSIEMTMMFYADLDRVMASRRYAEHILERRLTIEPTGRDRPKRRRENGGKANASNASRKR